MRALRAILIVGLVGSLALVATSSPVGAKKKPTIAAAAKACGLKSNLSDKQKTLTIDTIGEDEYSGDEIEDAACALALLETPDYIVQQIDATSSLDGMVKGKWRSFKATWNYHPDRGLLIIIHQGK